MAALLDIRDVTLTFGGLRALDNVGVEVEEGEIAGLIGPNGAGKTSLLNCISRFYQPQSGEIRLGDVDLLRHPAHALPGLGLARTFQHMELFHTMSVLENVLVGAHARHRPSMLAEALALPAARRAERQCCQEARAVLDLVGLDRYAGALVQSLPLGLRKRVGLARAGWTPAPTAARRAGGRPQHDREARDDRTAARPTGAPWPDHPANRT